MKVMITGGLGHLGSALIRALSYEITVLDNLSSQRYPSLYNLNKRVSMVVGDITTYDLERLFSGVDVVVHLAAITDAPSTVGNEEQTYNVNLRGTERVARACAVNGCRLFFPSTTSVYGKSAAMVDETCPDLYPQSPYAASKLEAERVLATIPGLRHVSVRCGTVFGPSVGSRWHTFVNKCCWQAAIGEPITLWRTAVNQVRPYLYLGDFVSAVQHVIEKDLFNGQVYNVVTGNYTPREVIDRLKRHRPDIRVEITDSAIMNQLSYAVSSFRFIQTGWIPKGDLSAGIAETMDMLAGVRGVP